MPNKVLTLLSAASLLVLAACDSAEERAQGHFESALELLQEGDPARAIIELRNVFQLDGAHRDARMLMAQIQEDRGNLPGAYGQYRAVVERVPDDVEGQRAAARIAGELGDWEAAGRHVEAARALLAEGAEAPELDAIDTVLAYQEALGNQDLAAANAVAETAAALAAADPSLITAQRVAIDNYIRRQDWPAARTALDAAVTERPGQRQFYMMRLSVIEQMGDQEGLETELRNMIERFPEDTQIQTMLIQWYVSNRRIDDAEAWLREQVGPVGSDPEAQMMLVAFLTRASGRDAALAELDRALAELPEDHPERALYRSAWAGLTFDSGGETEGIAEMEDILTTAEPSDLTRRIKVTLAQMLIRTGNPVGARALVEEVLEEDPSQVEALKMRAAWMIEDDRPDEALAELRRALDQAPQDASVLTLMAQAQERAGSRELMGEMLALAVEAANNAPAEAIRYANFLVQEGRLRPAEDVLLDALRLQPRNAQILAALGTTYIGMEDWGRSQGVIDALGTLRTDEAERAADELTARVLNGQQRRSELSSFLEGLASDGEGNTQAIASVVRLRLAEDDVEGALDYLNEQLTAAPNDPALRYLRAAVLGQDGATEEAVDILQALVTENPQDQRAWLSLYRLQRGDGDIETARTTLSEALENLPDSANLNWVLAGELELEGDIEGAIQIYERLYERDSNSPVIANNLASLMSSYHEDEDSLRRAFAIARRLRGTEVPAFQDTYGWIAARLGNVDEALEYLEPAAEGLPEDPTVRYHLARTYAMAGRDADARAAYEASLALIEATGRTLHFEDELRAELTRLETPEPADN